MHVTCFVVKARFESRTLGTKQSTMATALHARCMYKKWNPAWSSQSRVSGGSVTVWPAVQHACRLSNHWHHCVVAANLATRMPWAPSQISRRELRVRHLKTRPPGWKPYSIRMHAYILSTYGVMRKLKFSYSYKQARKNRFVRVWAKTMTPKLCIVCGFFMIFEYACTHFPWQYIAWWSQKWKNSVQKRN